MISSGNLSRNESLGKPLETQTRQTGVYSSEMLRLLS